jgi:hypothetical protein
LRIYWTYKEMAPTARTIMEAILQASERHKHPVNLLMLKTSEPSMGTAIGMLGNLADALGGFMFTISLSDLEHGDVLRQTILAHSPMTLVDFNGAMTVRLQDERLFDNEFWSTGPVASVVTNVLDPRSASMLHQRKTKTVTIYGSQEAMVIGIGCEKCRSYHVVDEGLELGVMTGGVYHSSGEGMLVFTKNSENFPFIHYANGDKTIVCHGGACGFGGTTVTPLGRTYEVKVPDVSSAIINWKSVYESFTKEFGPDVVFLYGRLLDGVHLVLATFIGCASVTDPKLDRDLSTRVSTEGSSFRLEYLQYLPVVRVPISMVRLFDDRTLNKRKVFVNCTDGVPPECMKLWSALKQVAG